MVEYHLGTHARGANPCVRSPARAEIRHGVVFMDLLIFDLDGTLIDSRLDLAHAVNAARGHMGMPPSTNERVYSYVGNGAPVLVRRALGRGGHRSAGAGSAGVLHGVLRDHMLDYTTLYPGVRESLDRLRDAGVRMAVLTNKPVRISRAILDGLGVGGHFRQVYGGNSFDFKKPHPIGVETLIAECGVDTGTHHDGGRQFRGYRDGAQRAREILRRDLRVSARDARAGGSEGVHAWKGVTRTWPPRCCRLALSSEPPNIPSSSSIVPCAQVSFSTRKASTRAMMDPVSPSLPSFPAARDLTSGLGSCNADNSESLVNV
jgi:phosphoglycolate phosphatase